jgi:SAM-dependent methyltransferase
VADLGSGTGSLSVLLAERGYDVSGLDLAPAMVAQAEAKAARHGVTARFAVGDAAAPDLGRGAFDVVLARHVVWALPDPATALRRWLELLAPGGSMVLIEGRWWTGGGLAAHELEGLLAPLVATLAIRPLTDEALWGRRTDDERFAVVARA